MSSSSNICAVLVCLALAGLAQADPPLPIITNQTFIVTNAIYGAIGDGLTNNAPAIQSAINDASTNGGGTVEIPADGTLSTYLSGPINLASGINLQIDSGAILQMLPRNVTTNGSTIIPKWPSASTPFILGSSLTDVAITGSGIIDGQGTNWWFPKASTRPNFIQFTHSTRVLIQDVTLQNPPTFHIMAKNTNIGLTIQNITINTPASSPNTDGMDLASTNVLIRNCFISDGDDNIEIGGSSAAAADITISNCTFGAGHGLSIGSLVNGAGGGVHDLIVSNCLFTGTRNGIHMKSDRDIGGVVQNLQYLDITMTNVSYPIAMYSYYDSIGSPSTFNISPFMASTDTVQAITGTTPIWRNITISNLTVLSTSGKNIVGLIWGLPEMLVSNVTLVNVNIFAPTKSFDIYNAQGIRIIDSNLTAPNTTTNTLTLVNAQVVITNTVASTNLVTLGGLAVPPTNNVLTFVNALAAITDTNMLGTGPFTLDGSTLTFTQDSVVFSNSLNLASASTLGMTSGSNTFSGALSGPGPLTFQLANSRLSLQGDVSGYSGNATVLSGTLLIDNPAGMGAGAITVAGTGTLGGSGMISWPVTVDGTLAPGDSPGTLTISNNLVVNGGAVLQYELGTNSDLTVVSGNLGLDGTLNITDAGDFTNGMYPLFTYGGTLTTNGSPTVLAIGTVPDTNLIYLLDIGSNGFVNLVVAVPVAAAFSANPTNGTVPLAVTFTDTSSGSISNRFWDFGDGVTTNTAAAIVMHTYSVSGNETVQLIVSGQGGVSTNTRVNYITAVCVYTLSLTNASFGDLGGSSLVTVSTANTCPWTAVSNNDWVQITGGSVNATGSAAIAYTVLSNTSSISPRTGTMTIAGQTFTVTQTGDTTPPTVVLTTPTAGIASNTIAVSATATDDVGVVRVEFYRDASVLLGAVTTPPYRVNFDTTTASDGSHCFYAKAYDLAGNVSATSSNCVTVDNHAPLIVLTAPTSGIASNTIVVSATATDSVGVVRVEFYRDANVLLGAVTTPPYRVNFDTTVVGDGSHCFYAKAYDLAGNVSATSSNCVTVDNHAPSIVLTSPTAGIASNTIAVSATAIDNVGVAKVEFYRDASVLLGTVITPPYGVSFDTTTVADGSHCFYARAYDPAGNVGSSATNCVTVDRNPPSVPVGLTARTIATNQINLSWSASSDSGSGVASYRVFRDGEQIGTTAVTTYIDIGLAAKTVYCYAVAAQDELGHVSAQSADACAQTFVTPVSPLGRYNGLAIQTNAPSHASSGSIKLMASKNGPFAASLSLGGVRSAFKGQFDISGNATNLVTRTGLHSLRVILHLDLVNNTDQITGSVSDGAFTSEVLADRQVFSATARCPLAGSFTVVLQPPEGSDPSIPEGFGYGTLTVTPTGNGRVSGVLADGTKINIRVPLSKHGTFPLYQALYNSQGASIGWMAFGTNSSVGATVDWFRPPMSTSHYFPAGFTTNVTLLGEKYVSPADGGPSVVGTNVVTLGGGNLVSSIVATVLVSDVGSVIVPPPNPENLQIKIQTKTGQFSGSFTHPVLGKTVNFNGLVLQLDGTGAGYFLGSSASGFVFFEPTP